ncbi:Early nodulin-like protein 1 [Rhynchospora pubera]|uniref:Early nodulin-like protein 1 n=1 Tax=Rhynchospora pubera TaxID=906938 RepID=A0AAV8FGU2_9POAL|nr:Early nodulin-like protein 1 [Rhynchospora pubera]
MAPIVRFFIALMAMAALAEVVIGTNYTVGAPAGSWDLKTNYTQWTKGQKFYTGDNLIFKYNNSIHDVREVTQYGYTWCSAAEPILADDSGFFVVELASNGTRYFICTISTHCLKGMKLQIDVLNSSSLSPPPPPVSSPNKAAVTQIGFANFVLGMIGLMLMVL